MENLILWSGGLNSTVVLLKTLVETLTETNCQNDVLYIDINMNKETARCERIARKNILEILDKIGQFPNDDFVVTHSRVEFDIHSIRKKRGSIILQSMTDHIINNRLGVEYDNIYLGFSSEDCFWHTHQEFKTAFENMIKFYSREKQIPKLKYPLEWCRKEIVPEFFKTDIEDIFGKKVYKNIINSVWSCDSPIINKYDALACGNCNSCITSPLKHRSIKFK